MSQSLSEGSSIHLTAIESILTKVLAHVDLLLYFLDLELQVDRSVFDPFQVRVEIGQSHLHAVDLLDL